MLGPRLALVLFGAVATASVLILDRRFKWLAALSGIATLLAGAVAVIELPGEWPLPASYLNVLRGCVAAIAIACAARIGLWPENALRSVVRGVLAFLAAAALLAFFNFGAGQFRDYRGTSSTARTFVHLWDMRVYFPMAKYFAELGFDGVYLASLQAYREDATDGVRRSADTVFRDLNDYHLRTAAESETELLQIRERFSPDRWQEFKQDLRYFWRTMGRRGYLGSLTDHGGNATPFWFALTHLLFANTRADDTILIVGGLFDPLLILFLGFVVWRTYGFETACFVTILFGTTTFPFFGTNWAGATLRHDWMVLLGLGVCALHARRFFLAGWLLAASALIRVFPLIALIWLAFAPAWWLVIQLRTHRRWPSLGELWLAHKGVFMTYAGAATGAAVMFAFSVAVLSYEASWPAWIHKISLHADAWSVNNVGLQAVVTYEPSLNRELQEKGKDWVKAQDEIVRQRAPLTWVIRVLFLATAALAVRRKSLSTVALIGTLVVPVLFYLSNYYLHIVFLLPMLASIRPERDRFAGFAIPRATSGRIQWFAINAVLLGLCLYGACIQGIKVPHTRYSSESVGLLIAYLLLLIFMKPARALRDLAPVPSQVPEGP